MPVPKAHCRARGGPGRWQKRAKRLLSLGGWTDVQYCNVQYDDLLWDFVRLVSLCVDAYCFIFWDLPGDVLAAPELALCG